MRGETPLLLLFSLCGVFHFDGGDGGGQGGGVAMAMPVVVPNNLYYRDEAVLSRRAHLVRRAVGGGGGDDGSRYLDLPGPTNPESGSYEKVMENRARNVSVEFFFGTHSQS